MAQDLPSPATAGVRTPRRQRTRDRLIAAAMVVLGHRSADASIIDDVIALADVSRGTFYNYFRTNDELLAAVAEEAGNELLRIVDPMLRGHPDPAARVADGVRLVLAVAGAHPQLARFIARTGPAALGAGTLAAEFVPRDVREGIAAGRFTACDPRLAFDLVTGPVLAAFHTLQDGAPGRDYADAMAEGVLRALGVPGASARRLARRRLGEPLVPADSLIARAEALARQAVPARPSPPATASPVARRLPRRNPR